MWIRLKPWEAYIEQKACGFAERGISLEEIPQVLIKRRGIVGIFNIYSRRRAELAA